MSSLVITTQSAVTDDLGYSYVYAIIFCEGKNYFRNHQAFLSKKDFLGDYRVNFLGQNVAN